MDENGNPTAVVDGFTMRMFVSYGNAGEAWVQAPDGGIATLSWETGSPAVFEESVAPKPAGRWGAYTVRLDLPLRTDPEAEAYLQALLPDLIPRWHAHAGGRTGQPANQPEKAPPLADPILTSAGRTRADKIRISFVIAMGAAALTAAAVALQAKTGHDQDPTGTSAAAPLAATASAKEFIDPVNGIAATFHTPPLSTKRDFPIGDGTTISGDLFQAKKGQAFEEIIAMPLPCMVSPDKIPDTLRDSAAGSLMNLADGTASAPVIEDQELVSIQSYPGIRTALSLTDQNGAKTTGTLLTILHGSSLVLVIAHALPTAGVEEIQQGQDFIDSFRFLDQHAPTAPSCDASPEILQSS